jgi:hypothetical protein
MVWDYYHDALAERPQYRRDDGQVSEAHLEVYFSDPTGWPEEYRRQLATLDALATAVRPGGHLLADFNTPARCPASYLDDRWLDDDGVAYRRFRVEYDDLVGPWVDILLLEPAALNEIARATAWEIDKIVGPAPGESDYRVSFERN